MELLGKDEFVRVDTPREAARETDALTFREKRFAAPKGSFSPRTLDRDARDARRVRNKVLMVRRRARGLTLINAESPEDAAVLGKDRRAPHRSQSMIQDMRADRGRAPARVRANVLRNHLYLLMSRY